MSNIPQYFVISVFHPVGPNVMSGVVLSSGNSLFSNLARTFSIEVLSFSVQSLGNPRVILCCQRMKNVWLNSHCGTRRSHKLQLTSRGVPRVGS